MTQKEKALYYAEKQYTRCSPYVWSGQGQKLNKLTVEQLASMENSGSNAGRVAEFVYNNKDRITKDSKIFDCSGFVICCLIYAGVLPKGYDATANDLMNNSKYFDKVDFNRRQPGDVIFKIENSRAYHTGIVTHDGYVAEAKGRAYGVVNNKQDSVWTVCRRPKYT